MFEWVGDEVLFEGFLLENLGVIVLEKFYEIFMLKDCILRKMCNFGMEIW